MWNEDKFGKRLILDKVDRKEFNIQSKGNIHLVSPKRNKWDWTEEEKWMRSIIVDDNGYIKSCSFPKFGNYGEFKDDSLKLDRALESGDTVRFSHKEDGSLCIRSVIDGKVVLRTRGTIDGGFGFEERPSFNSLFTETAEAKYPIILNPNWMSDVTLLFEYVSPKNQIVIKYEEADLVFIGVVEHFNPKLWVWQELIDLANKFSLNLVKLYTLPKTPKDIIEEINTWHVEGVVARINNDQTLVKIKSSYYFAQHRMRFSLNYSTLYEIVSSFNIKNEEDLVNFFRKKGYDWELVESAKNIFSEIQESRKLANSLLEEAKIKYNNLIKQLDGEYGEKEHRKNFAQKATQEKQIIKTLMFLLYSKNKNSIHDKISLFVKNNYKQ